MKPTSKLEASQSAGADELAEYRRKRDPTRTNEPFGPERKRSPAATRAGRFVVHLHDARRRHYDLRLQIGRTLKSFAVPRGPSLDPKERRLAVNTEDHPIEYMEFENIIPEGSYGAGAMIAWDVGKVSYLETSAEQGYESGKIDFVLHGYKLRGRFGLIRTRRGEGNDWLLIKKQDAFSRAPGEITEEAPWSVLSGLTVEELAERQGIARSVEEAALQAGAEARELDVSGREPMLCAQEGASLADPDRIYELKLDGVRILADKREGAVALRYRNGGLCTVSYPEIARAVEALPGERLVLDGEIVAFDERGRPSFERILPRIQARRPLDVARVAADIPLVYLVFDLLAVGSADLTELPLHVRKRLLPEIVRGKGLVRSLDHFEAHGQALFEFCKSEGLEGVVAKRKGAPYRFGPRRSDDWVKVKCEREGDFVVVGWVEGKGTRGSLGALCLATYQGDELVYRGRVGSGFDHGELRRVSEKLAELRQDTSSLPLPIPDEARAARWVRPELVAHVRYLDFTEDGRLRAPVYAGLRPGASPRDCVGAPHDLDVVATSPDVPMEPAHAEEIGDAEDSSSPDHDAEASDGDDDEGQPSKEANRGPRRELSFSNRNKVFWPEQGYTKGDLIDYYARVAEPMLRFLEGRPVVLVRYPDGIHGKSFYQWNVPRGTPDWMRRLSLRDPEDPTHEKTVFIVDDESALLYLVQLGCIPLHVLACREGTREHCDFLTIDFDLNEQPFSRAVELALTGREILTEAGLLGFPKTSGQGGLHLLVPLGPNVPFEAAKLLVELLGRLITARHPEFATMERRIDKRGGKLYVDTGQTGTSRTIVAPYSVRAVAGATVSTPLHWDELSGALDPRRFTIQTVPDRSMELGDPFQDFFERAPDIAVAVSKLETMLTPSAGSRRRR